MVMTFGQLVEPVSMAVAGVKVNTAFWFVLPATRFAGAIVKATAVTCPLVIAAMLLQAILS